MRRLPAKHLKGQSTHCQSSNLDIIQMNQPDPKSHVYNNLPTPTSIPVRILAPENPDAAILCSFSLCKLQRDWDLDDSGVQQRYTALSYGRGSTESPARITVSNDSNSQSNRDLYDALKSLRRQSEVIVLWVNAVCINQKDPDEKKIQIGLMHRVYKQAEKVIAYEAQKPEDIDPFQGDRN